QHVEPAAQEKAFWILVPRASEEQIQMVRRTMLLSDGRQKGAAGNIKGLPGYYFALKEPGKGLRGRAHVCDDATTGIRFQHGPDIPEIGRVLNVGSGGLAVAEKWEEQGRGI